MRESWIASAPGKLVLIGEYAVLEGYPAVVAAIDRRAAVRLEPSASFAIDAPQLGIHNLPFEMSASGLGSVLPETLGLVGKALESHAQELSRRPAVQISIDTEPFLLAEDGSKLGLGSSAAVASALTAALGAHCRSKSAPDALLREVHDLHYRFQGKRGSGIDVAASVLGGCLRYQMTDDGSPDVHPRTISLPDDLFWTAVWSGAPASTPELIGAVRRWSATDPAAFTDLLAELGSISTRGADALTSGDTQGFLTAAREYGLGMARLGASAAAAIVTDAHLEIADIVESVGGVYKPSGAGGGDLGLAFANSPGILQEAQARLAPAGYPVISLALAEQGIRIRHD